MTLKELNEIAYIDTILIDGEYSIVQTNYKKDGEDYFILSNGEYISENEWDKYKVEFIGADIKTADDYEDYPVLWVKCIKKE